MAQRTAVEQRSERSRLQRRNCTLVVHMRQVIQAATADTIIPQELCRKKQHQPRRPPQAADGLGTGATHFTAVLREGADPCAEPWSGVVGPPAPLRGPLPSAVASGPSTSADKARMAGRTVRKPRLSTNAFIQISRAHFWNRMTWSPLVKRP